MGLMALAGLLIFVALIVPAWSSMKRFKYKHREKWARWLKGVDAVWLIIAGLTIFGSLIFAVIGASQ